MSEQSTGDQSRLDPSGPTVERESRLRRRRAIGVIVVGFLMLVGWLVSPSGHMRIWPGPTYSLSKASTLPDEYQLRHGSWVALTVYGEYVSTGRYWWMRATDGEHLRAAGDGTGAAAREMALRNGYRLAFGADAPVVEVASSRVKGLRRGDRVIAVNGQAPSVESSRGTWLVVHKGRFRTVSVPDAGKVTLRAVQRRPGNGHVALPSGPDAVTAVAFKMPHVDGPSAGLVQALAWADILTPGDLTGGRKVAATGVMHGDGSVGPVDGIRFKLVSARRARVQVVFVPRGYEGPVPSGLKVVRVGTVDQAVEWLRTHR